MLALDAGNVNSYPGTGTAWVDTIGGLIFTLEGGVAFGSSFGGYLIFNAAAGQAATSTANQPYTLTQFTTEAWYYYTGANRGDLPGIISQTFNGGYLNFVMGFSASIFGVGPYVGYYLPPGDSFPHTLGVSLTPNKWYHLVGSFDGGMLRMYVNGVLAASAAFTTPTGYTAQTLRLMKRWAGSEYVDGWLAVMRVYNRPLQDVEVLANYVAGCSRFGTIAPVNTSVLVSQGSAGTVNASLCATGRFAAAIRSASCAACLAGAYCNSTGLSAVTLAPRGYYANQTGLSAPSMCGIGYFSGSLGLSACTICPGGYFCNATGLTTTSGVCYPGQYSATGSSICTVSGITYYVPTTAASAPLACPAGSFCNATGLTAISGQCGAGSFSAASASACTIATQGWYVATAGAGAASSCTIGFFCNSSGLTAPLPCPIGAACAVAGASAFVWCGAGYFSNMTSQSACTASPAGTWANGTGLTMSAPCPSGWLCSRTSCGTADAVLTQGFCLLGCYMDNGARDFKVQKADVGGALGFASACSLLCTTSYMYFAIQAGGQCFCGNAYQTSSVYVKYANSQCLSASTGLYPGAAWKNAVYSNTRLFVVPSKCPVGYYCPTGSSVAVICPVGTTCATMGYGDGGPLPCPAGFYSNATAATNCTACPAGSVCNTTGMTAPVLALPGFYANQTGLSTSTACPAGRYDNTTGLTRCLMAPAGSWSAFGASSFSTCPDGWYSAKSGLSGTSSSLSFHQSLC